MEIEKIIYEEHDGVIETMFKKEYIGTKGIWALYGKESENSDYVCLNVGKANKNNNGEYFFTAKSIAQSITGKNPTQIKRNQK